jgi:hypothetical protein
VRDARIAELTADSTLESPPPTELPSLEELEPTREPSGTPTVTESEAVDLENASPRRAQFDAG